MRSTISIIGPSWSRKVWPSAVPPPPPPPPPPPLPPPGAPALPDPLPPPQPASARVIDVTRTPLKILAICMKPSMKIWNYGRKAQCRLQGRARGLSSPVWVKGGAKCLVRRRRDGQGRQQHQYGPGRSGKAGAGYRRDLRAGSRLGPAAFRGPKLRAAAGDKG
ncbi:hypothetical protein E3U24_01595 [Paracoccus pantotrophus]|nr:hypothetical protein EB844_03750 [Paracoccus pantotrophus]WGR64071.1 hypothetical protein E3U24_01595 [Paracoccus pantotrophus]